MISLWWFGVANISLHRNATLLIPSAWSASYVTNDALLSFLFLPLSSRLCTNEMNTRLLRCFLFANVFRSAWKGVFWFLLGHGLGWSDFSDGRCWLSALFLFLFSFGLFFFFTFSYSLMTSAGPCSLFLYKSPWRVTGTLIDFCTFLCTFWTSPIL